MTEGASAGSMFSLEHTAESGNDDSTQSCSIGFKVGTNSFKPVHRY